MEKALSEDSKNPICKKRREKKKQEKTQIFILSTH